MATLDLSRATVRVDMTDPSLVQFGTAEMTTADVWSFNNTRSTDLQLEGSGMTFNAQGRALTGTVNRIGIDIGDNDFDNPDISITGVNVAAATLDDGAGSFWRVLEGNDTIIGMSNNLNVYNQLFGDGLEARPGSGIGGNDTILAGTGQSLIAGDVWTVGAQTAGAAAAYRGGADAIIGEQTYSYQSLTGDAQKVYASGTLLGGDDTILIKSIGTFGGAAIGDASSVEGIAGDLGIVTGGNDLISADPGSTSRLIGDVFEQVAYSLVTGGNDRLTGGSLPGTGGFREEIIGDVFKVGDNQMVGGADLIWGNGGDDFLFGDFQNVGLLGKVTGGNDTIFGGAGNDRIWGDGTDDTRTTGGNDRIYGDQGDDSIYAGTGNDFVDGGADSDVIEGGAGDDQLLGGDGGDSLKGGAGNDYLDGGLGMDEVFGGTGNDTYIVEDPTEVAVEYANEGVDTVISRRDSFSLQDQFENLTYQGAADFSGTGNAVANTLKGSSGADYLNGADGNDLLIGGAGYDRLLGGEGYDILNGGAGADKLEGGAALDTASYDGSEQGVRVSLDGSVVATGDAAGDTFDSIESLVGTRFNDLLVGDAGKNELFGGDGNDVLNGRGDTDLLVGGLGNDTYVLENGTDNITDAGGFDLIASTITRSLGNYATIEGLYLQGTAAINASGNALNNVLVGNVAGNAIAGGAGNDALYGDLGNDILAGGTGNDAFVFRTALNGATNRDAITDFANVAGNNDTVQLENAVFTKLAATGVLNAAYFRAGAAAADANDFIVYNQASGALYYDADGNGAGAAVQFATLSNHAALTAADFLVI